MHTIFFPYKGPPPKATCKGPPSTGAPGRSVLRWWPSIPWPNWGLREQPNMNHPSRANCIWPKNLPLGGGGGLKEVYMLGAGIFRSQNFKQTVRLPGYGNVNHPPVISNLLL